MIPDHPNAANEGHKAQEGSSNRVFNSTPSSPNTHADPSDDHAPDHISHQPSENYPKSKAQSRGHTTSRVPIRKSTRGDHLEIARANVSMAHLKPIIKPLLYLIGGCTLAIVHHFFNSWADGRPIDPPTKVPQVWVLRIGTGFAFAFKTIIAASLSFVICQLLWFSTRRKHLTVQDIDTLYSVERRDVMSTVLSNAVMHGPLLVGATILSFMLPIAAVFTPASLGVRTMTYEEHGHCVIVAGNLRNHKMPSLGGTVPKLYVNTPLSGYSFHDVSTTVARISDITFSRGAPIPLPEFCGKNCTYKVSVDSMAFKCEQNIPLPDRHMGTYDPLYWNDGPWTKTFWNATATGDQMEPTLPIYVGWATLGTGATMDTSVGTTGSAYCTPVSARYDFTVKTMDGAQAVSYNVTTLGQLPPAQDGNTSIADRQIASIAQAARRALLGSISFDNGDLGGRVWNFSSNARLAPFLNLTAEDLEEYYVWGDVVKGINETTANITASLLTLDNGRQNSTCSYGYSKVVYDYNRANLLAPYSVAISVVAVALTFGVFVFLRFNPDDLTTSFADTLTITRSQEMERFARKHDDRDELKSLLRSMQFRLGELPGGYLGYGAKQDFHV
ncbi:hypothetical protein FRC00_006144 [Tulasnella sp. 408]|nr:hypothetical protein FRC00_006144 [Tulasnella sp. 408]